MSALLVSEVKSKPPALVEVGSDRRSYINLCIQHDDEDNKYGKDDPFHWWNLSHGFMEFLRATHTITSSASKIRDFMDIRRYIFTFLKDPEIVIGVSFCTYRLCSGGSNNKVSCMISICEQHGWCEYSSDEQFHCADSNCTRVYCWKHNSSSKNRSLSHCDVCKNNLYAEMSITGCYEGGSLPILCPQHAPIQCTKRLDGGDDDEEGEIEEDCYNEDEGNDGDDQCKDCHRHRNNCDDEIDGQICGFYCCRSCLDDHNCGDDPHDYL